MTLVAIAGTTTLLTPSISCRQATPPPATTAPSKQTVAARELSRMVEIVGDFGRPLGTVITIEGRIARPEEITSVEDAGQTMMLVDSVDNGSMPVSPMVKLGTLAGKRADLSPGGRYRVVGFEHGSMLGIPSAAFGWIPKIPTPEYGFGTWFVVLQAEGI